VVWPCFHARIVRVNVGKSGRRDLIGGRKALIRQYDERDLRAEARIQGKKEGDGKKGEMTRGRIPEKVGLFKKCRKWETGNQAARRRFHSYRRGGREGGAWFKGQQKNGTGGDCNG